MTRPLPLPLRNRLAGLILDALQQYRYIVIQRDCRPHASKHNHSDVLMSTAHLMRAERVIE